MTETPHDYVWCCDFSDSSSQIHPNTKHLYWDISIHIHFLYNNPRYPIPLQICIYPHYWWKKHPNIQWKDLSKFQWTTSTNLKETQPTADTGFGNWRLVKYTNLMYFLISNYVYNKEQIINLHILVIVNIGFTSHPLQHNVRLDHLLLVNTYVNAK